MRGHPMMIPATQLRPLGQVVGDTRLHEPDGHRLPISPSASCPPTSSAPATVAPAGHGQHRGQGQHPTNSQCLRAHEADAPGTAAVSGVVVVYAQAASQKLRQED